ncbi:MAG: prepilin-type N-terminal cleavage/methylation domain-containing protein [Rhodanobacteraceae bacterium]|nr:MAG: prepilin-type N-terminal cleavage/methylation domain-containing protein [Rhodanobacteraceae bacterium]
MQPSSTSASGFTLTELLTTLAIAGLLAALGMPALGSLVSRVTDTRAATAITGSLHQARAAAVVRGTRVLLCPSRDRVHCRAGDDWQHGWIIGIDTDADGQPDAGAPLIAAQAALHAGTRVITSRGRGQIVFHPNGSAAGSNARFTICRLHTRMATAVVVANSGRVRLAGARPDQLQACLTGGQ